MREIIKEIILWLFIFIIGSLIVSFILNPISFESFRSDIKSISADVIDKLNPLDVDDAQIKEGLKIEVVDIKELSKNPSNYVGQEILMRGKLNRRVGGNSLEGKDDYWIWIDDNCLERGRDYEYDSQSYIAQGEWIPGKIEEFGLGWGIEFKNHLSCNSPIN